MSINRFALRSLSVAAVLTCSGATMLYGQTQASIVGTVTDASGAAIPGVKVTITNEGTGQAQTVESNGSGNYAQPTLSVGTYTVTASGNSFKQFQKVHVPLNIGDTLRVDVQLQVGSVNETTTVTANAVQIQTSTNEVSTLIDSKQISQLDTNGRNISGLVTLTPGVTGNNADFTQPLRSGSFSVNGGLSTSNVFTIDGTEQMDRGSNGSNMSPSADALSEFKVLTSNYSADYGSGGGGTIAVALKSGSRDFHGNLWEYGRNDALNASNYFAKLAGTAKPKLRFNTFGGNFSGPLFIPHVYNKDRSRTFFFVNEEARRYILGAVVNYTLPVKQEYGGDFTDRSTPIFVPKIGDPAKLAQFAQLGLTPGSPFPGNKIPASLLDPNIQLFLNAGGFPVPNSGSQYIANANSEIYVREDIVHVNHTINSIYSLDGHLVHFIANEVLPASAVVGKLPTVTLPYRNPAWNGAIKLNAVFTPNLVNQIIFNFNANGLAYDASGVWQQPAGWTANKLFAGNDPLSRLPNISIGAPYSGGAYGSSFLPYHNFGTDLQERDDLFWTKGKHNLKFGASYTHYVKNQMSSVSTQGTSTFNGSFTGGTAGTTNVAGNSFADMLLGLQSTYSEGQYQPTGHLIQNFGAVYAMDDWRIIPRLTINIGLRWEFMPHGYDRFNQISNFIPSSFDPNSAALFNTDGSISQSSPGLQTLSSQPGSPIGLNTTKFYMNGIRLAGRDGFSRGLVRNYWANAEPRVGFAYDLDGNGKTVVRAGVGLFLQEVADADINNTVGNAPFTNVPSLTSVYFSKPGVSTINGQAVGAAPIFPTTVSALDYNYHIPYTWQQSVGIQRQISRSAVATLAYVGSLAFHQPTQKDMNTTLLSDPNRKAIAAGSYNVNLDRQYRGYSSITQISNAVNANYNSLQATLRLQDQRGDAVHFAYTYSKALGVTSGTLSNPFDPHFDYGPTSLDQRHVFVVDYILPIPIPRSWNNAIVKQTLGGWELTGITYMQSGQPVTTTLSINNLGIGGGTARPNLIAPLTYPRTRLKWFDTSAFQAPAFGSFGTASAFSIRQPGRDNWNIGLFKTIQLNQDHGVNMQFRADAYNAFNHTQFQSIQTGFNASNFGQVTSAYDPRVFQLSLRLGF